MHTRDFARFVAAVGEQIGTSASDPDQVLAVRRLLTDALQVEGFVLDCVEIVLDSLSDRTRPWRNPPIFVDAQHDYAIRIIYWPPRYANNPHEHRRWTVTGNIHNRLDVLTYAWGIPGDVDSLHVERTIVTQAGEVGYILPPCVHSVVNPAAMLAASFHIFSGLTDRDGKDAGAEDFGSSLTTWYPTPRKGDILRGVRSRALATNIEILERFPGPRSLQLLDETFKSGDARIQLASVKAMCRIDVEHAARRAMTLAEVVPEPARAELSRIGQQLLAASGAVDN